MGRKESDSKGVRKSTEQNRSGVALPAFNLIEEVTEHPRRKEFVSEKIIHTWH